MVPTPVLNEDDLDLLISHPRSGESISEEIINAFRTANIDVSEKSTRLFDWINSDVLESIRWDSISPVYLSKRIWGQRVVITGEEIRIYEPMNLQESD
ncbi:MULTISPECIES: hypothetical protein [Haloferacaceae]|uniref:Halobacterial output domain-containing protein n=1 Tax=Halorubrum glutamatedens TaxID=2707018 RepID=A0ABD5QSN9_9EURY|nr:hypothetical protein [Halobellus captivus]